jgi:hypothetical protein
MTYLELSPFDPTDPFDVATDDFRQEVTMMAARAFETPPFRDLEPNAKVAALAGGVLTGLIGTLFISVTPEGRETIMNYIINDVLPFARKQAEAMLEES